MTGFVEGVTGEVITGVVALPAGAIVHASYSRLRDNLKGRPIVELFGLRTGSVTIIHSSIFDEKRDAYNYPAADSRASREVARLLNSAHRNENRDFHVRADVDVIVAGRVNPSLWRTNLILLCGPKRNPVVAEALSRLPRTLKYSMSIDPITDRNVLRDNRRNHWLNSSQDESAAGITPDGNYDYGLILSLRNPFHADTTLTVLAGIHGTGTLGCVDFLSSTRNIRRLLALRENGTICEVVKVRFGDTFEAITDVEIA